MALHVSRLRALPAPQRASALKALLQRARPEELPELRQALAEAGLELAPDVLEPGVPVRGPVAQASALPPGATWLEGLPGAQVVAALRPLLGQRVGLHVGKGEQRHVLSAVLKDVVQVGRHARVTVCDFSPWSASSVRQPGEALFEPWPQEQEEDAEPGSFTLDLLPSQDAPRFVQPLPREDTPAMRRASSTDRTVQFHDLAQAIHRGEPYPVLDLGQLRAELDSGARSATEVEREVERVLKALTSAAIRPVVERTLARPDFRARVLEGADSETFGGALSMMADVGEALFGAELKALMKSLDPGPVPGIDPSLFPALRQVLAFQDRLQRKTRPLGDFLVAGFGTGAASAANLAHVTLTLHQRKHGQLPSTRALGEILQRSRGLLRHELAGADLRVFMDVAFELGAPHWTEDFFQLTGDPERVEFHPDRVREFAAEHGRWLDTKSPTTSGCPARALGSIDLIVAEMEACILVAYAQHAARPDGVEL